MRNFIAIYLIFFYSALNAQIQKFEGHWEGEISFQNKIKDCELTLFNNQIADINYLNNAKQDNLSNNFIGEQKIGIGKSRGEFCIVAKSEYDKLIISPFVIKESGKGVIWSLDNETTFKYYQINGEEFLESDDIKVKKVKNKGDIIKYEESMSIYNSLDIKNTNYISNDADRVIKTLQTGNLQFTVVNDGKNIIESIQYSIEPKGDKDKKPIIKNYATDKSEPSFTSNKFEINAKTELIQNKNLYTNTEIDYDNIEFVIKLLTNGIEIKSFSFKIPSEKGSLKTHTITLPSICSRTTALDLFFGRPKFDEATAKKSLDELVEAKDVRAIFWKALFLKLGAYGYNKNHEEAVFLTKYYDPNNYNKLLALARQGDAESLYLIYECYFLGLVDIMNPEELLPLAFRANYEPALLKVALQSFAKKENEKGITILENLNKNGFRKAGFELARVFDTQGGERGRKLALDLYTPLLDAKSNDAILRLAELKFNDKNTFDKGVLLTQKAVDNGSVEAMITLSKIYFAKEGVSISNIKAINLLTKAMMIGSSEAMLQLGLVYTKDNAPENQKIGVDWFKKAALNGNGLAMKLLSLTYEKGFFDTPKDDVLYIYWRTAAGMNGIILNEKNKKPFKPNFEGLEQSFYNYKPHVLVQKKDQDGFVVDEYYSDDNLSDQFISTVAAPLLFQALTDILADAPPRVNVNKTALIKVDSYKNSDIIIKTYAGVLSDAIVFDDLEAGDIIDITTSGSLLQNWFDDKDSAISPNGVMLTGKNYKDYYDEKCYDKSINFCACMIKFNEGKWKYCMNMPNESGTGAWTFIKDYQITEKSKLKLQINDKKKDHLGYFHVILTIKRKITP